MMCWIADANNNSGTEDMTFEEFITYCVYFFDNREHIEGIKYLFQVLDADNKGYLSRKDYEEACTKAGLDITDDKIEEIFQKASSDGKNLKFSEFAYFM